MGAHWTPLQQLLGGETPPQETLHALEKYGTTHTYLQVTMPQSQQTHFKLKTSVHEHVLLATPRLVSVELNNDGYGDKSLPLRKTRLLVTVGLPFVSVPVLSKITIFTRVALSKASAPCGAQGIGTTSPYAGLEQLQKLGTIR